MFCFTFVLSYLPFPQKKNHKILLDLMEKTKQIYVLPKLANSTSNKKFLLMDVQGAHYIFSFVVSFLKSDWHPK